MTDNTKDPVRELRELLVELGNASFDCGAHDEESEDWKAVPYDGLVERSRNAKAAIEALFLAAIPHSQQRETVAARGVVAWANVKDDGTICGLSQHAEDVERWLNPQPLVFASQAEIAQLSEEIEAMGIEIVNLRAELSNQVSPVAAPVPEAKAEQVGKNSGCRMTGGICACRSGGSFGGCAKERNYCCTNEPAAPAVKHEASELPPDQVDWVIDTIKAAPARIAARADMTPRGNMSVEFPPIAAPAKTMNFGQDDNGKPVLNNRQPVAAQGGSLPPLPEPWGTWSDDRYPEMLTLYREESVRTYGQACATARSLAELFELNVRIAEQEEQIQALTVEVTELRVELGQPAAWGPLPKIDTPDFRERVQRLLCHRSINSNRGMKAYQALCREIDTRVLRASRGQAIT